MSGEETDVNSTSSGGYRMIFAPGDLPVLDEVPPTGSEAGAPARAHQFTTNPPLTFDQLHAANPLQQFTAWFRDDRIPPPQAPETATLATVNMESGRVSARVVYLKELDERGWVIYSNWGSPDGKGAAVFGVGDGQSNFVEETEKKEVTTKGGHKWAALTFFWPQTERQVRIEGKMEALPRKESEKYWRTRARPSQIGAWASQQSKVLWETDPSCGTAKVEDDGRQQLEDHVQQCASRFDSEKEIPLPPFWGGARLVPESVEFWQGRANRLHDRFLYVRHHEKEELGKSFAWHVQRLSP